MAILTFTRLLAWLRPLESSGTIRSDHGPNIKLLGRKRLPDETDVATERAAKRARAPPAEPAADAATPPARLVPIESIDWLPLLRRCERRLGWSPARAAGTLEAYKQFLQLKIAHADWDAAVLSPPLAVDEMWHMHILDTRRYAADCAACAGAFVHHDADGDEDRAARERRVAFTQRAYLDTFDTALPPIWAFNTPAAALAAGVQTPAPPPPGPAAAPARTDEAPAGAAAASTDESLRIRFRDKDGEEEHFIVKPTTRMEVVFNVYSQRRGVNQNSFRFLLDGERINADSTPRSLDLEDDDQIDAMLEQGGC